jgi:hypothetical protein
MEPPAHALTDWLDLDDAVLPVDFASHLDAANLARLLEKQDRRQHRMALLLQALVQLVEAQGLVSEAQVLACGQCGRDNLGNRQRCLYCGSEQLQAAGERS